MLKALVPHHDVGVFQPDQRPCLPQRGRNGPGGAGETDVPIDGRDFRIDVGTLAGEEQERRTEARKAFMTRRIHPVEDTERASTDGLVADLIGVTESRREIHLVSLVEPAIGRGAKRKRRVERRSRPRIRVLDHQGSVVGINDLPGGRVPTGDTVLLVLQGLRIVVPQTEVQREFRSDLPVILEVDAVLLSIEVVRIKDFPFAHSVQVA